MLARHVPRSGAVSSCLARSECKQIGAMALTRAGDWLLLAGERAFWAFDIERERFEWLLDASLGNAEQRFNDGRVDSTGAFWVGTLVARDHPDPDAGLFCLTSNWTLSRTDRQVFTSNGLAVTGDGRWLLHADSRRRTIWRQQLDDVTGSLSDPESFFVLPKNDGVPDGAAFDSEGGYWLAVYGGWRVCRILDGRVYAEIRLPVASPTMCAFGGADLKSLLITSSSRFLSENDKRVQPLAGGLFQLQLDIAGMPEHRFAGDRSSLPVRGKSRNSFSENRPITDRNET